jgi:hypothetical protein
MITGGASYRPKLRDMARRPCPNPSEDCKYFNTPDGCFADQHHPDWPAKDYRTPLEKRYRISRAFHLCRLLHDIVHLEPAPEKPTVMEMREHLAQIALKGATNGEQATI